MGYLVNEQIRKYSKILNYTDLTNMPASITCFSGDLIIDNIFLGAKFQMFDDNLNNFGTLTIIMAGSPTLQLGQYEEINGSIFASEYCLFGNICNSANGFGFISSNLLNNGIGIISTTSPNLSNPNAYGILTIYMTL